MSRYLLASWLLVSGCAAEPPHFTVWAWEGRHDLRSLPEGVDVALFAGEANVDGASFTFRRRAQPALLRPGTLALAVIRVETHGRGLSNELIPTLADTIVERATAFGAPGLQLDFDARVSERESALALLRALRDRWGTNRLSMTGLASWCTEAEPWVLRAPVDELVPQLFRLGADAKAFHASANAGAMRRCGDAVGVSTDEAFGRVPGATRVFVFHPGPWRPELISEVEAAWR